MASRTQYAGCLILLACVACTGTIAGDDVPAATTGTQPARPGPGLGAGPVATTPDAPAAVPDDCDRAPARDLVPPPARLRRLSRHELLAVLRKLGATGPAVAGALVDDIVSGGTTRNVELLTTTSAVVEGYWDAAKLAAAEAAPALRTASGCAAETDECLGKALALAIETAWRRRSTTAQVGELVAGVAAKELAFGERLQLALRRVLLSPRTMYFQEGDETRPASAGIVKLTPFQAAEQLSFTLMHEPPDRALMDLAAGGTLLTPAVWAAQVDRALADPRARAGFAAFFDEWLRHGTVLSTTKDSKLFPEFDEALRGDMLADTMRTLEHLFFQANARPAELLVSPAGVLSPRLARFLGASAGAGPADVAGRVGLMTHPSVLSVASRSSTTGLISRARVFFDELLCQHVPDPPPEVTQAIDAFTPDPKTGIRARIEAQTAAGACQGCHRLLDPVAFALETYDPVGRARVKDDAGIALRTEVTVKDLAGVSGTFAGFADLARAVAATPAAGRCFTVRFARYAIARAGDERSACKLLRDVAPGKDGDALSMRERVRRYFTSASFLERRIGQEAP